MKTISGREMTVTVATRLPISDYERVQEVAQRRGVKMACVLREWIKEGLSVQAGIISTNLLQKKRKCDILDS